MKKTLFLIPLVLVLVSCKKKSDDPLKYELNLSNTYTAILEDGSTAKKVSVPKKYNGKEVTELSGFRNNSYIESVTFTSNITKIDAGTFTFCEHLKKISVSNSDTFKTIDGNLYDSKSLLVYASGKNDETFETDYNISSRAFTCAPNLKKIKCNGNIVEDNAFMFLESIEEIYISSRTNTISDNFIYGIMPKRLVVNNKTILDTLTVKDIKEVYVIKNGIVSEDFLSKYNYVEDKIIDKETYLYYEVK